MHFRAMFISAGSKCSCMSLCLCVFDILGMGGERGQIAASFSHIIGQLFFIHRNESTLTLSIPHGMIHAFVLYCLPKKHSAQCVCVRIHVCACLCLCMSFYECLALREPI